MHARITRVQVAVDKIEEARAKVAGLLPEIRSIPGLKEFINVVNDDGGGVTIALYNSKEELEAATPRVSEILSGLAGLFTSAPTSEAYEVDTHEVID